MGVAGVALILVAITLSFSLLRSVPDSVYLGFRCDRLWSRPQDVPGVRMTSRPAPQGPGPDAAGSQGSLPEGRLWPSALAS